MNFTTYSNFTNPAEFFLGVNDLLVAVNKAYDLYWKRMGFKYAKCPEIRVNSEGKRFARLSVYEDRNGQYQSTSVWAFIDLNNGNIHKAASYKAAETTGKTKGIRGNIFSPDVLEKVTIHGVAYLNGGGCFDTIKSELENEGK